MSRGRRAYFNGLAAEDIAARHYQARGGKVVARRWKGPLGEIDLVIEIEGVIVFAEVKARKSLRAALGALSAAQQARLTASAAHYLSLHSAPNAACRFDLVALDSSGQMEIIENALM